jgi:hypothetical protein
MGWWQRDYRYRCYRDYGWHRALRWLTLSHNMDAWTARVLFCIDAIWSAVNRAAAVSAGPRRFDMAHVVPHDVQSRCRSCRRTRSTAETLGFVLPKYSYKLRTISDTGVGCAITALAEAATGSFPDRFSCKISPYLYGLSQSGGSYPLGLFRQNTLIGRRIYPIQESVVQSRLLR